MSDRRADTGPDPGTSADAAAGASDHASGAAEATAEAASAGSPRRASLWGDAWYDLRRSPLFIVASVLILVFVLMAAFPGLFTDIDPTDCSLSRSLGRPSRDAWFGYDIQGCDYYARTIYGARASVVVGTTVALTSSIIAVIFGSLAGFYRGWIDALIARVTDVMFALPTLLAGIVILSVLDDRGVPQVALVLAVLGWPTMLRLMRSSVMSVAQSEYVSAARALGATNGRIIVRHVLPNAITPVLVYATIFVGIVITAEASLTFLGVGLQLPAISWGLAISNAQSRLLQAPHLLFFPGLFLSVTVFAFILLGDALRDALDPKLR